MPIANDNTQMIAIMTNTFRFVARDFNGNTTAKKRSHAMAVSVKTLPHIEVTETREGEKIDDVHRPNRY
jgi:predicted  nucleic acid-binding Zn ribbon protein